MGCLAKQIVAVMKLLRKQPRPSKKQKKRPSKKFARLLPRKLVKKRARRRKRLKKARSVLGRTNAIDETWMIKIVVRSGHVMATENSELKSCLLMKPMHCLNPILARRL